MKAANRKRGLQVSGKKGASRHCHQGPDREPSPAYSTLESAGHGQETCYLLVKDGCCEPGMARGPVAMYGCASATTERCCVPPSLRMTPGRTTRAQPQTSK